MRNYAVSLFLFAASVGCSDAKLPDSSFYTVSPIEGAQHLQNATDVDTDELDVDALRQAIGDTEVSIPINNYSNGNPVAMGGCPWAQPTHKGTLPGLPAGMEVSGDYLLKHGYRDGDRFVYSIPLVHNAATLKAGDAQLGAGQIGNYVSNVTGLIQNFNQPNCAPTELNYQSTTSTLARGTEGAITRKAAMSSAPKKRTNGCFAASSQIHLADGSKKFMLHLGIGDLVLNPVTKKPAKILEIVAGPEELALYEIGIGAQSVRVTSLHPFLTDAGLRQAKDLKVGQRILNSANRFEALTTVRVVPNSENQVVYNLTLDSTDSNFENHALLVDGIVSGDLLVQQNLSQEINNQSRLTQAVAGFFTKIVDTFSYLFAT